MDDLQGGLNQVATPAPAQIEEPKIDQPTIQEPQIKEPIANLQDKAMTDIEMQRAALNNQIKNMITSANTRSANQLFDPKLMALASGLLAPTKTGGFGESLGAGLGKMSEAATQEEKERQENAKMRLDMMSTGLSLQEKQLAQDLLGKLYKTDKDGNPTSDVDPVIAAKLAKLTGEPKYQQMVVADLQTKRTREAFNKIFPTNEITNPDGTTKSITTFDPSALKDVVKASNDPAKTLGELSDTVKKMRQNGMLGDNTTKDTPFDAIALFAKADPAIQKQAQYYATKYKSGLINDEEADKYAKSLMDLYEKGLTREDQNVFKQLMLNLRSDQIKYVKEQKVADKSSVVSNALTNLDLITDQVSHVKDHTGRFNGLSFGTFTSKVPYMATDAKDYVNAVETLKSQAFLNQVGQMRGMGALSDREGKQISAALANLNIEQSKKEFDRNLNNIIKIMDAAKQRQIRLAKGYGITEEDLGLKLPSEQGADTQKSSSPNVIHYDEKGNRIP